MLSTGNHRQHETGNTKFCDKLMWRFTENAVNRNLEPSDVYRNSQGGGGSFQVAKINENMLFYAKNVGIIALIFAVKGLFCFSNTVILITLSKIPQNIL